MPKSHGDAFLAIRDVKVWIESLRAEGRTGQSRSQTQNTKSITMNLDCLSSPTCSIQSYTNSTQGSWAEASYLGNFLCDVVRAVDEFAGCDDVHFSSREADERVRFKVHKVERDLWDFPDGAVTHQIRIRGRVQDVGFVVHGTCVKKQILLILYYSLLYYKLYRSLLYYIKLDSYFELAFFFFFFFFF